MKNLFLIMLALVGIDASAQYLPSGYKSLNQSQFYDRYILERETSAILARAKQEGFTLPDWQTQVAINVLIKDMKADGFWQTRDVILNFAYNNTALLNFSLINWKNPFGPLAVNFGAITYSNRGIAGDGISAYISTGFNLSSGGNYTLNNASFGTVISNSTGQNTLGGTTNTENRWFSQNTTNHRINTGTALSSAVDMTGSGFKMMMRTGSANVSFINGISQTDIVNASTSISSLTAFIFRSGSGSNYGSKTLAVYFIGSAATYTQSQNFRSYYNKFLNKLTLTQFAYENTFQNVPMGNTCSNNINLFKSIHMDKSGNNRTVRYYNQSEDFSYYRYVNC